MSHQATEQPSTHIHSTWHMHRRHSSRLPCSPPSPPSPPSSSCSSYIRPGCCACFQTCGTGGALPRSRHVISLTRVSKDSWNALLRDLAGQWSHTHFSSHSHRSHNAREAAQCTPKPARVCNSSRVRRTPSSIHSSSGHIAGEKARPTPGRPADDKRARRCNGGCCASA